MRNQNTIPASKDGDREFPAITERHFGIYEDNPVTEFTLSNNRGMEVSVINFGGAVTRIVVPDRNGNFGDVVTGFSSFEGYLQINNPYFGALIGRYANRIAGASFTIDEKMYQLTANDMGNSLHGGSKGFDKMYWHIEKQDKTNTLKLTGQSKDGDEGYPGNLEVTVHYTLSPDNSLTIGYAATTDKTTPVNLTSHIYFNLSAGASPTILDHLLQLYASNFTPVNNKLIPTGEIVPVVGTSLNFLTGKRIGIDIHSIPGGFDHNWILDKVDGELSIAASLFESESGRKMEVWTTEPGIQFYSGNFLDGTLAHTKHQKSYVKHGALCLETQHFPDSPNQPGFPSTLLKPGETYHQTSVYKFSTF